MNCLPPHKDTFSRPAGLFERMVPRFLVKLARTIQNIGLVDLLHPVARPDSLNRYGNGFVSDPSKSHHVFNDCFGKLGLLLLRPAGMHFHDDMRHDWLLCYFVSAAARYSSSLTFSSQSTTLPSSASWIAIWLMPVVAVPPCQCFSRGGQTTTSPARISRLGPPPHCTQPQPAVTINLWPSGWVCHAVRAPGSNVTNPAETRDGSVAGNSGSIRTLPVKCSAGPLAEGCEPLCLISIALDLSVVVFLRR